MEPPYWLLKIVLSLLLGSIILLIGMYVAEVVEAFHTVKLIEKIEKFTQFIQKWSGINCFRISHILIASGFCLELLGLVYADHSNVNIYFLICTATLWLLRSLLILLVSIATKLKEEEAKIFADLAKGLRNYRKVDHGETKSREIVLHIPVALILLYCLTPISVLLVLGSCVHYLGFILRACDPLSPTESKIRQWVNGFKAALQPPIPVPTSAFRSTDETLFT